MIDFKITFLLAFLNDPQYENSEKPNKHNAKNKKKAKKRISNMSKKKSKKKSSSSNKDRDGTNSNEIDAGRLIGTARIDLKMLPNVPSVSVDVMCHERVAKTFSHPESKVVKVLVQENIIWVPVHLSLKCDHLKYPDELVAIANNFVALCQVSMSRNKLGNVAKKNKIKDYHFGPNVDHCSVFKEVFEQVPTTSKPIDFIKRKILVNSNYDQLQQQFMDKIINKEEGVWYNQFIPFSKPPLISEDEILSDEEYEDMLQKYNSLEFKPFSAKQKVKKKKFNAKKKIRKKHAKKKSKKGSSKKSKSSKPKKGKKNDFLFQISGESYFTNPNICIYKINSTQGVIKNLFMMVSVDNFLTLEQKQYLMPFIINIKKIMNLPYDFLLKHRFESIYLRYSCPQLQHSCSTMPKLIADYVGNTDLRFDEAHVCFIRFLNICKVQEFFQTRKLKVEVVGVRDEKLLKTNPPFLFGNDIRDKSISNISTVADYFKFKKHPKEPIEEVLAVCCFDLAFPTSFLQEIATAYLHHPESRIVQTYEKAYRTSPFNNPANKAEINLNYKMFKENRTNPVTESLLVKSDTCMKLEWFLMAELDLLSTILASNVMYRRGIFVLSDRTLAASILRQIMFHNQEVLTTSVTLPNYFHTLTRDYLKPNQLLPHDEAEVVTGFVVDNFDTFLFYLETRSSLLLVLFEDLSSYTDLVCHLLFDSNLVFEKRLYVEFLNYGGYYILTMQQTLQEILRDENVYMKGNLPIPCYEALMKMDLLLKSYKLSTIYKRNLLPTSKELLSLQLEFGAAHRWTDVKHCNYNDVDETVSLTDS